MTDGGSAQPTRHLLALAAVLLLGMVIVGPGAFSADEGAAIVQAQHLAAGDGWIVDHPFPEADPEGEAYPLELGLVGENGTAPFAKHPVYAATVWGGEAVDGWYASVIGSVLATVLAAWLAARIVARFDTGLQAPTLWLVGLGTPLLFDSYTLIAHSISAAAAGAMALGAITVIEEEKRWGFGLLLAGGVVASSVRTEASLFAVVLAVACVVASRNRRGLMAAGAVVAGAAAGYATTAVLRRAIVGSSTTNQPPTGIRGGSFLDDRFQALRTTWLRTHYGPLDTAGTLLALGIVLLIVAIVLVRRDQPGPAGLVVVGGAVAACLGLVIGGVRPVPGLLIACPVLTVGFFAIDRLPWSRAATRVLAFTTAGFALGVLATQYRTGGSGEWGGRYFAMLLPLAIPLAVVALDQLLRTTPADTRRAVVVSLAAVSAVLAVFSVATLRRFHDNQQAFSSGLATVSETDPGDGGEPVVVATGGFVPRMAWDVFDDRRWLLVDLRDEDYPDQLAALAARLDELGVERWTLVTRPGDDAGPAAVEATAPVGEPMTGLPSGGWIARPVG